MFEKIVSFFVEKPIVGKRYLLLKVFYQEHGIKQVNLNPYATKFLSDAYTRLILEDLVTGEIHFGYHNCRGIRRCSPLTRKDKELLNLSQVKAKSVCKKIKMIEGNDVKVTGNIKRGEINIKLLERGGFRITDNFYVCSVSTSGIG